METRGLKLNTSELLCLSWLPATLMMIRSKIEWASMAAPFSHYKSIGNFLDLIKSQWSELAEIQTCPRLYASPRYLQV